MHATVVILFLVLFAQVAEGQPVKDAAVRYNLFNPVPQAALKEMETDRPDVTESAYTVEAGHFQMESDLVRHVINRGEQVSYTGNVFNFGNYKLGLTENMDVQLVIPAYTSNIFRERNTNRIIGKSNGFDDISLRVKYNVWGNAGGSTAFAVLPFISFPTASFAENGVQGGIVFPFAADLKNGWGFGAQAEVDIVKEDDNKHYTEFLHSVTFNKSISKKMEVFVETFSTYSLYSGSSEIFGNGGIIVSLRSNLNVDAGFNYGLNKSADKVYFVGFSFRY